MPWSTTRKKGTHPKYRTRAHRVARAAALAFLKHNGTVQCAQPECIMPTRTIHHGDPTHLGHNPAGTAYIGLVHPQCNVRDGAKRGNQRSRQAGNWAL